MEEMGANTQQNTDNANLTESIAKQELENRVKVLQSSHRKFENWQREANCLPVK